MEKNLVLITDTCLHLNSMLSDLCRLTTSAPKQVVGDLMSFTVTNSDLKNEADSKFFFEEKYTSRADLVEKNSFVSFLCIVWWH